MGITAIRTIDDASSHNESRSMRVSYERSRAESENGHSTTKRAHPGFRCLARFISSSSLARARSPVDPRLNHCLTHSRGSTDIKSPARNARLCCSDMIHHISYSLYQSQFLAHSCIPGLRGLFPWCRGSLVSLVVHPSFIFPIDEPKLRSM